MQGYGKDPLNDPIEDEYTKFCDEHGFSQCEGGGIRAYAKDLDGRAVGEKEKQHRLGVVYKMCEDMKK
jgi:hypothetical protein